MMDDKERIGLINDINDEIGDIEIEITKLQETLEKKKDYLNKLRNDNMFNDVFSNSSKDVFRIEILTCCKYDNQTTDPWTNIIVNSSKYNNIKHTITYPESFKFNSDFKELILKYVNGGATTDDVSIVNENERLSKEVESLKEEIKKLRNKDMWHIESLKMFNALSWWKKMRFKFNISDGREKVTD